MPSIAVKAFLVVLLCKGNIIYPSGAPQPNSADPVTATARDLALDEAFTLPETSS